MAYDEEPPTDVGTDDAAGPTPDTAPEAGQTLGTQSEPEPTIDPADAPAPAIDTEPTEHGEPGTDPVEPALVSGPRDGDEGTTAPAVVPAPGVDEVTDGDPTGSAPAESDPTGDASAHGTPGGARVATSGWVRLGRALRFRRSRAQVLAALLCALLGFALVVQVRQTNDASLADLSQADLVRILDETTTRGDALATEVNDLRRERDELVSGSDRRQAALDALRRSAETQGILSGRLPAEGTGVVATLTEPKGQITPATMLNMLEELRNAGAEAIDLNGERITASSAFAGIPGAVTLDDVRVTAPFVWKAIGDPDTISTALQIPGGALAAVRNNGGEGTLERRDNVKITSIRALPAPQYAKPSPAATS